MEINLGGKSRPVAYTINALIEFEEITGLDLIGSREDAAKLVRLKNIRALAFVGLKHGVKEPDFTIEDVGNWISFNDGSIGEIMKAYRKDVGGKTDSEEKTEELPN